MTHSRPFEPGWSRPSTNAMAPRSRSTWKVRAQPTPQYGQTLSTASSSLRGRIGTSWIGLLVSAPVGQAATHSPQVTQDDSPIGSFRSNAMRVA